MKFPCLSKPLLVTTREKQYIWMYHMGQGFGPFNYPRSPEFDCSDPHGCPANPTECIGGQIHVVENPLFPPAELFELGVDELHQVRDSFCVDVVYDKRVTDADTVAAALGQLLDTVTSTPGILDEEGIVTVEDFFVQSQEADRILDAMDTKFRQFMADHGGSVTEKEVIELLDLFREKAG